MPKTGKSRRTLILAAGTGIMAALAGCADPGDDNDDDNDRGY